MENKQLALENNNNNKERFLVVHIGKLYSPLTKGPVSVLVKLGKKLMLENNNNNKARFLVAQICYTTCQNQALLTKIGFRVIILVNKNVS